MGVDGIVLSTKWHVEKGARGMSKRGKTLRIVLVAWYADRHVQSLPVEAISHPTKEGQFAVLESLARRDLVHKYVGRTDARFPLV